MLNRRSLRRSGDFVCLQQQQHTVRPVLCPSASWDNGRPLSTDAVQRSLVSDKRVWQHARCSWFSAKCFGTYLRRVEFLKAHISYIYAILNFYNPSRWNIHKNNALRTKTSKSPQHSAELHWCFHRHHRERRRSEISLQLPTFIYFILIIFVLQDSQSIFIVHFRMFLQLILVEIKLAVILFCVQENVFISDASPLIFFSGPFFPPKHLIWLFALG